MDMGVSAVLAAFIATAGGVLVAVIQLRSFRKENRDDHALVQKRLDTVIDMVAKTSSRLTDHLEWHKEPSKTRKQVAARKR